MGAVRKAKRLRFMGAMYSMLARRLDAVCAQALFAVWRGICGVPEKTVNAVVARVRRQHEIGDTVPRKSQADACCQADLQPARSSAGALAAASLAARAVMKDASTCTTKEDQPSPD